MYKHKLSELEAGETAFIAELGENGSMRRRLFDMGMIENTFVECVGKSPGGGLSAFLLRGTVIALRPEDSEKISIRICRRLRK